MAAAPPGWFHIHHLDFPRRFLPDWQRRALLRNVGLKPDLRICGGTRAIGQANYFDHAVRKDQDLRKMARYIVANPLRANLVGRDIVGRVGRACRSGV